MENFLFLGAGIVIGVVLAFLLLKNRTASRDPRNAETDRENAALKAKFDTLSEERKRNEEQLKSAHRKTEDELQAERNKNTALAADLARSGEELKGLRQRLDDQKSELQEMQEKLKKDFELLANKIFEEKSKKFTDQNRVQLDDLLKPFGEKIKDFEKKVNDAYVNETKERASLKEQIVQLHQLNQQMSKDAQNLTRALKGETKTQGNWGEFILESILEKSGLRKDYEYRTQESFTGENGKRFQPDVIIDLPEDKHLVVDSKVSLVAFERFISSENETERAAAIQEHVDSVRKHIRELSGKKYQQIYGLHTLDFVLLFMPVEPAFALALQSDQQLFNDAFEKNIVIVSPSTLLATLRTVANIWRQELQNKNVIRIAEEAAAMYEKFVGFTDAMIEVGRKMESSQEEYKKAMSRLSTGPGNVIKRIENLKQLGLKVNKEIDPKLIERASGEEPTENES